MMPTNVDIVHEMVIIGASSLQTLIRHVMGHISSHCIHELDMV